MPRIPSRISPNGLGTYNPAAPGRAISPALQYRGPVLPQELFSETAGLDPATRRALNQIQSNVRQAFAQVRGSPFSYANIISGWILTQGGSDGASPNIIAHGLGQPANGYAILSTTGGYVTAHALITPAPNANLIQVWTQYTAFSGVTNVTAEILVYG